MSNRGKKQPIGRGDHTTNADHVVGPCPFCHATGGTIDCDFTGEHNETGQPRIAHSIPECEAFVCMSGDEFVHAVINREHLQ